MAAKLIQVSDDAGVNWHKLPGNSGSLTRRSAEANDTIFGHTYQSGQPTLISLEIAAQAFYKGFAAYNIDLKKPGTSTVFTTEACTLISGKRYKITDTTKNIWDRTGTPFDFFDNAVNKDAEIESVDWLFGEFTFKSTYTVVGPVTVTGKYFPATVVAKGQSYTLRQSQAAIRTTTFDVAQANNGNNTYDPGLRQVALQIKGVYALATGWVALLEARTEIIIELDPVGDGLSRARGFFKVTEEGQSGNVGELEEEDISFTLAVPPDDIFATELPFEWKLDALTKLSPSLQKCVVSYLGQTKLDVRYLHDGVNGYKADSAVLTELSMAGDLDGVHEFRVSFNVDGALTTVP